LGVDDAPPVNSRFVLKASTAVWWSSEHGGEAGLIKSSPNKLIADGTDWRFLNELKRELNA
jgi:hypothetical protein